VNVEDHFEMDRLELGTRVAIIAERQTSLLGVCVAAHQNVDRLRADLARVRAAQDQIEAALGDEERNE
jgi:hypothetical protein